MIISVYDDNKMLLIKQILTQTIIFILNKL